jgi:hypothetical protein
MKKQLKMVIHTSVQSFRGAVLINARLKNKVYLQGGLKGGRSSIPLSFLTQRRV